MLPESQIRSISPGWPRDEKARKPQCQLPVSEIQSPDWEREVGGRATFLVVGSAALRSLQVIPTDHLCVVRFLFGRKKSKGLLEFEGGE